MKSIRTIDDLYPAVDELIAELNCTNGSRLAALHHRVHEVAWTSGSELVDALQTILARAVLDDGDERPPAIKQRIMQILTAAARYSSRLKRD